MRGFGMALAGLALLVPACGVATDDVYAQAPPGQNCRAAEHHQFDFWIGDWNVMVEKEAGKPQVAGVNRIEAVMDGCALAEHWESAKGGHGTSLNFYDRRTARWHQTWIDEGGNGLLLSGAFTEGRMVRASPGRTARSTGSPGRSSPTAASASSGSKRPTGTRGIRRSMAITSAVRPARRTSEESPSSVTGCHGAAFALPPDNVVRRGQTPWLRT
jgi:hypothetical protein